MKNYFLVYKKFFETSFAEVSSFRTSFVLIIFMDLAFYLTTLTAVTVIYDHVQTIGPWKKDELLFFITFMLSLDHLHMIFFSENFWELSRKIRLGLLDFDLLRPKSSIFSVFFRYLRVSSIVNTPIVWGLLYYYGNKAGVTATGWVSLPFLMILSLTLFVLIEFILSTSMFWVVEGFGINFLRMQFQQLARWPDFIYSYYPKKLLSIFIPVLLVGSNPVKFLIEGPNLLLIGEILLAIVIFFFILKFCWKKALDHYESPSS